MYFKRLSYPKNHIIFQIYEFQHYRSFVTMIWYQKTTYHFKRNAIKKIVLIVSQPNQVVQTIPFVNSNRDDDARSCPGTVVHASGTSQSLPSPFVLVLQNCGHDKKKYNRKKQTDTKNTSKQYT